MYGLQFGLYIDVDRVAGRATDKIEHLSNVNEHCDNNIVKFSYNFLLHIECHICIAFS